MAAEVLKHQPSKFSEIIRIVKCSQHGREKKKKKKAVHPRCQQLKEVSAFADTKFREGPSGSK